MPNGLFLLKDMAVHYVLPIFDLECHDEQGTHPRMVCCNDGDKRLKVVCHKYPYNTPLVSIVRTELFVLRIRLSCKYGINDGATDCDRCTG